MKKIVFLICICCAVSYSQAINFPDTNFKARLLQSSPSSTIAYGSIGYIKIDANNNGEIEQSEALMVTNLNINGQNINNLEGLQYFTNLTVLGININNVTSINLSPLTQLVYFSCNYNQISSFDFSNLPNLRGVYCDNNLLTTLDFSYNPLFEDLTCKNNPNLISIKIKNNHQQLFGSQTQLNECWSGCPNLNYICADDFEIPALQSYLQGCGITQAITIDSACPLLGVDGFEAGGAGVYPNPTSGKVVIDGVGLYPSVSVYNCLGQEVVRSFVPQDDKMMVDLSGLPSGVYLVNLVGEDGNKTVKVIKE